MASLPGLGIDEDDVDMVPLWEPDAFRGAVARINVDVCEGPSRTKNALQELARRVAGAFQGVVGQDRKVRVAIRPYDVGKSGWVSS